jgi:hypothetical protein
VCIVDHHCLEVIVCFVDTNITKTNKHLSKEMVNNSHQYKQSKQSPLDSDGQQFTPISTKQTITSKK